MSFGNWPPLVLRGETEVMISRMKIFGAVFFFIVLLSATTFSILNYDGQLDTPSAEGQIIRQINGPSVEDPTIRERCETDPRILKWDEDDKVIVSAYGSQENMHRDHVNRCVEILGKRN